MESVRSATEVAVGVGLLDFKETARKWAGEEPPTLTLDQGAGMFGIPEEII